MPALQKAPKGRREKAVAATSSVPLILASVPPSSKRPSVQPAFQPTKKGTEKPKKIANKINNLASIAAIPKSQEFQPTANSEGDKEQTSMESATVAHPAFNSFVPTPNHSVSFSKSAMASTEGF